MKACVMSLAFVSTAPFLTVGIAQETQVDMVRRAMPAVVGIGIHRGAVTSYTMAGTDDYLAEFATQFSDEIERLEQESTPQWNPREENIEPEDIRVIGSGFIVSSDGRVLTAYHLVEGQHQVFVLTSAMKVYLATVINSSPADDAAVLQIEQTDEVFPVLALGDSEDVQLAETVIAIGNPFGFTFTVTSGIISAVDRDLPGSANGLIQTDAPINAGSSGGPLINAAGEAIGVNHAIRGAAEMGQQFFIGLSFAVPVNRAKPLLTQPARRARPQLGLVLAADRSGYMRVIEVRPEMPAAAAGLLVDDTILAIDKQSFASPQAVAGYIAGKAHGGVTELLVRRNQRVFSLEIEL